MTIPITQVDAFTDAPFAGNPAAVCLLTDQRDDRWMQGVASEMNLSETAFLRAGDGTTGYDLRWFTPAVEVDLCGHATLASAHMLWEQGLVDRADPVCFNTRSGRLTARWKDGEIEMDFPARPESPAAAPVGLVEALGVAPRYVGKGVDDYLVEVESESVLRSLTPDFRRLTQVQARGVIVTALAAPDTAWDIVSRFFAPSAGIDEDPVTGSAHCCLGPFWRKKLGQDEFRAYQASSRGGWVGVRVDGDRVFLTGRAVTTLRGELCV